MPEPETQEQPTTKLPSEAQVYRQSTERWMSKLRESLPNPSLGGSAEPDPNPDPDPDPNPAPKVETQVEQPVTAVESKAAEAKKTEETEERWPRSAKEWKTFTTARKVKEVEYQKQLSERDVRIKDLEAKTASQPAVSPEMQKELDALKQENEEYSKQLRLVAVKNHPKFVAHYDRKMSSALAQLKSCVPADQIETVTKLLQQPDSDSKEDAINNLLDGMTSLARGRFIGVINSLSTVQTERDAEITRAQTDYEQMMAQVKTEKEQRQAGFTKMLEDTVKSMQDASAGRPEYQLRAGETEWNNSVQKRLEAGRNLITGNLSPEIMFKAAFDAAAYPDVLTGYRAALGEVDKLKKQIAAMSAANPRVEQTRKTETNGNPPAVVTPGSSPQQRVQGWVKKFGQAMQGE